MSERTSNAHLNGWAAIEAERGVPARFATMHCDRRGCPLTPSRAPRIIVPSKTWLVPGHAPLRMMTTLHYCELHKGDLKIEEFLRGKAIADFEKTAKIKRPIDFVCDFDAAFIEFVLVTTPEYRAFLHSIEVRHAAAG